MTDFQLNPPFSDWRALEKLLRDAYAPMTGRIDPPSFLNDMTLQDIIQRAQSDDLFLASDNGAPIACGFGVRQANVYELGKVAVASTHRHMGFSL